MPHTSVRRDARVYRHGRSGDLALPAFSFDKTDECGAAGTRADPRCATQHTFLEYYAPGGFGSFAKLASHQTCLFPGDINDDGNPFTDSQYTVPIPEDRFSGVRGDDWDSPTIFADGVGIEESGKGVRF